MTELCRMIPYKKRLTFKQKLGTWWYNIKQGRWLWLKEWTCYRGVNKGDPGYEDAPVSYGLVWHTDALKKIVS